MDREFLQDLFSAFGPVSLRRMFSGYGVSVDGVNFALVLRGAIYFRTDEHNVARFEDEGVKPFQYAARGKLVTINSYWQLPDRLYDDPEELAEWARASLGAAERAAAVKRSRAARSAAKGTARGPAKSAIPATGRSGTGAAAKLSGRPAKAPAASRSAKPSRAGKAASAALNAQRKARGESEYSTPDFLKKVREVAGRLNIPQDMLRRGVNVGFSGGEKKRNEVLQMALFEPSLCILDEMDSGLDIDALRIAADGVNALRSRDRGMIVITHYQRLLNYIVPDVVHVMSKGKVVKSGGKELALELEASGYAQFEDAAA